MKTLEGYESATEAKAGLSVWVKLLASREAHRQFRIPRLWSNAELERIAPLFRGRVVNVSGWDDRDKEGRSYQEYFSGAEEYSVSNVAGERGVQHAPGELYLDLSMDLPSELVEQFDVVFNHTTLEHVFDVRQAMANLCRMSSDVVIVVVPFIQPQHQTDDYGDFWRFTPTGLTSLFAEQGFKIVYLSETSVPNAGTYLFCMAARDPTKWSAKVPAELPRRGAPGGWVGQLRLPGRGGRYPWWRGMLIDGVRKVRERLGHRRSGRGA